MTPNPFSPKLSPSASSDPTSNPANHTLNGGACTVLTPMVTHPRNVVAIPCASIPTTVASTSLAGGTGTNLWTTSGCTISRLHGDASSVNTALEKNCPIARSCHKMVFDTNSGCIPPGAVERWDGMPMRPENEDALRHRGRRRHIIPSFMGIIRGEWVWASGVVS